MSSAIVLPTLTQWVENHLTAIIQAKTQTELESTLDAFFSKNATIIVNGTQISRADIFTQLYGQKIDEQSATVNFTASVAVPTTPGDNFTVRAAANSYIDSRNRFPNLLWTYLQAGSVGVFYTVTIAESIRVLGGPVTKQVTTSLNAV